MNEFRVKNDLSEQDSLFSFVSKTLADNGITDAEFENRLCLCIDEIFANIVRYGYPDSLTHEILFSLTVRADERTAELRVEDDGIEFNPLDAEVPDITIPAEERGIGGLGLFIVSQVTTARSYERLDGRNVLRLSFGW